MRWSAAVKFISQNRKTVLCRVYPDLMRAASEWPRFKIGAPVLDAQKLELSFG